MKLKTFFAFIRKEFYHIFRDKRTLLILFGMPIIQVVLFGFAITNEVKNAEITVLDRSFDPATREITDKLLSSGYFHNHQFAKSEKELEPIFQQGETKLAVLFEPRFNENLQKEGVARIQLIADATDPNTANLLISYASAIIRKWQQEQAPAVGPMGGVQAEYRMVYNPEMRSVFMFVPGVITIILMLVSAMMTSIAVTREKEVGTMEIMLVSPISPAMVIIGKVIPYLGLALFNALVILGLGFFVFGMPIEGSLALLLLECLLFVICSLSLGILISTLTSSQQTAMMISLMVLMLPTIILSGFIFPIENMPLPLQVVSNIIPAKWFIIIVKDIMLKGSAIRDIWVETMVLAGMTLCFIVVSIKKFKVRLE